MVVAPIYGHCLLGIIEFKGQTGDQMKETTYLMSTVLRNKGIIVHNLLNRTIDLKSPF